jgi:hypothetical protein
MRSLDVYITAEVIAIMYTFDRQCLERQSDCNMLMAITFMNTNDKLPSV